MTLDQRDMTQTAAFLAQWLESKLEQTAHPGGNPNPELGEPDASSTMPAKDRSSYVSSSKWMSEGASKGP